ncbi:hypothetical protein DA2_1414 [Desulfovibrio sp. A2]|nr:hypothetical protein DA2_1414 [Desulfovibrio sp. A2]
MMYSKVVASEIFFREARKFRETQMNKEAPMRFISVPSSTTAFTGSDRCFARGERFSGTGRGA